MNIKSDLIKSIASVLPNGWDATSHDFWYGGKKRQDILAVQLSKEQGIQQDEKQYVDLCSQAAEQEAAALMQKIEQNKVPKKK